MYIRSQFEETCTDTLHELMRRHPLGTLVTLGNGSLNADHVPFEIDDGAGPFGMLRAHLPRANPAWREASYLLREKPHACHGSGSSDQSHGFKRSYYPD